MNTRIAYALAIFAAGALVALFAHRPVPPPPAFAVSPQAATAPKPPSAGAGTVVVYVAGAVRSPGVYTLPHGARAIAALRAAGGGTAVAELRGVNLAELLDDGQEVLVPERGDPFGDASTPGRRRRSSNGGRAHSHGKHHRHRRSAPDFDGTLPRGSDTTTSNAPGSTSTVDLNTADSRALAALPGIGASLAERIVAFRELSGAFDALDDLLDVGGMTQSRLDRAAPYLRLGERHSKSGAGGLAKRCCDGAAPGAQFTE